MTGLKIENKRNLPQVWRRGSVRTRVRPRGGVGDTLALCLRVSQGCLFRVPRDTKCTQESHAAEAATCGNTAIQMFGCRGRNVSEEHTDTSSRQSSGCFRGPRRTLLNRSSYQGIVASNRNPQRQGGRILLEINQQRLSHSRYNPWRLAC